MGRSIERDPFVLPPLTTTSISRARREFAENAEKLLREWEYRRQAKPPVRRAESANAWFKREAYRFLRQYIDAKMIAIFQHRAMADRRPHKLVVEAAKNPFKLGLLAMFVDESALSRNNRLVFGNQMLYAWLHDVPPDFINAFLAVSGGPAQIAEKLKTGEPEPGFEHRFGINTLTIEEVNTG